MRPLNLNEIYSLSKAKQNFRDCYLVSAIGALTQSPNGKKILSQNIQREGNDFCIRFNNVKGKPETYLVKKSECDDLILVDKYFEPIHLTADNAHHPIIKAVEVAMNKLLKQHPDKKPFICRIPECTEKFEFNKVSNFLEMFTGIKPITINESGIKMTLKKNKNSATSLINRIAEENKSSFVVGSGYKFIFDDLPHCWSLKFVDSDKKLNLYDHRRKINVACNLNEALSRFKFICGYFNDMLKPISMPKSKILEQNISNN